MNKRELAKIPVRSASDEVINKACDPVSKRYMVTAERIQDNQVLILYFFSRMKLRSGDVKADYRFFISRFEYITQDLRSNRTKWLTGRISTTLKCWKIYGEAEVVSDQDENIIKQYFANPEEENVMKLVQDEQDRIHTEKVNNKLDKERMNINNQMKRFQALPDDFDYFLREDVMSDHYLFYSKKENYCFCTNCRYEYKITGNNRVAYSAFNPSMLKHNEKNYCKMCGSRVTCKGKGIKRGLLLQNKWAYIIQKHGKEIHTRIFSVYWDLRSDYKNTDIVWEELYRSIFSEKSHYYYEIAKFHGKYEERWCHLRDNQRLHHMPRNTVIYIHNIPEVFQETPYQYCMLDEYIEISRKENLYDYGKEWNDPFMVDNYLALYQKYPYIESLMKLGCHEIVKNISRCLVSISGVAGTEKNNQNTLSDILKLNKQYFKILMQATDFNPTVQELYKMQEIYKLLRLNDTTDILKVFVMCKNSVDVKRLYDMTPYFSVRRIWHYIAYQKEKANYVSLHDLEDHRIMLTELHYNVKENLLPADFAAEHARIIREREIIQDKKKKLKDEKYSVEIEKRMLEMNSLMNFKMNGLMVMAPHEAKDIRIEGRTLHHCVGTYVERVAKGKTNIFFVRKEETPEVPYFTMEINMDGVMIQCQGKYNCSMPDDVKAFAEAFTAVVKQYFIEQKMEKNNRKVG